MPIEMLTSKQIVFLNAALTLPTVKVNLLDTHGCYFVGLHIDNAWRQTRHTLRGVERERELIQK